MAMNLTLEPKGMLREVLHHILHRSNALGPGGFYLDSIVSPTSAPTIASISTTLKRDWVTALHQYGSYPNFRSITLQDKGLSEIREC